MKLSEYYFNWFYFADTGKKRVKKIEWSEGYTEADKRESAETMGSIAIAMISLEVAIIFFSDVNPYTIYHLGKKIVRRIARWNRTGKSINNNMKPPNKKMAKVNMDELKPKTDKLPPKKAWSS